MPKRAKSCFSVAVTLMVSTFLSSQVLAQGQASWKKDFQKGEKALGEDKPKDAELCFRSALKGVKAQSGSAMDVEKCMQRLAATLALTDRTAEARKIYLSLLKRVSSRYGRNSKQVEPVLMALGSIQESLGNHSEAMVYYNRALRINEKNYGNYSPAYAGTLSRIGRVNRKMGRRQEARLQYKQAISILSKNPNKQAARQLKGVMSDYDDLIKDEDHSNKDLIEDFQKDILRTKSSGSSEANADNKSSSLERLSLSTNNGAAIASRETTELTTGHLPRESQWQKQNKFQLKAMRQSDTDENREVALRGLPLSKTGKALNPAYEVVNDTIFNQARYERDEAQYKRKIAIDIDALGPSHPSVANDLNSLAQLYISKENFEEAKPLLTKALAIYSSTYGFNNVLSINTLSSLAKVEFRLGQYEEAAKHYREALSYGQKVFGPNSLETAKILNGLAYLYYYQGKLDESLTFYKWAISSTEGALGESNPLLAACLKDYARVLRRVGQGTKADQMEVRASSILAKAK